MTNRFEVVRIIHEYREQHGYAPTQVEIAVAMHITEASVRGHIRLLCASGYLTRTRGKWRSLNVVRIGGAL